MNSKQVQIIEYQDQYAADFARLNYEWLEKHFDIEAYDRQVLNNPQKYILDNGGYIYFAIVDGLVAGTVALINRGKEGYELSKMGVTEQFQGLRIGQKLMYACIHFAGQKGITRLFLDSNTVLKPAINLYNKVGFREIPVSEDTPYERCNIRMELKI